jgi:hypothetical protein
LYNSDNSNQIKRTHQNHHSWKVVTAEDEKLLKGITLKKDSIQESIDIILSKVLMLSKISNDANQVKEGP